MNDLQRTLKESFKDKEYRHGYVDDFLNAYIATQIKVLREKHGWNQKELAERAGMMQPRISVMENVNYASWSVKILRKIAEAFDLTLCVSFESFGRRIEDIERFGRKNLEKDSFDDDPYFKGSELDDSDEKEGPEDEELAEQGLGSGGGKPTIPTGMLVMNPSQIAKLMGQGPQGTLGQQKKKKDEMVIRGAGTLPSLHGHGSIRNP